MPPMRLPAARPRFPLETAETVMAISGSVPAIARRMTPPSASPSPNRRSRKSVVFESAVPAIHVAIAPAPKTTMSSGEDSEPTTPPLSVSGEPVGAGSPLDPCLRRSGRRSGGAVLVLLLDACELLGSALHDRPLEPLVRRQEPPTAEEHQGSADGDRRVIEVQPREALVPGRASRSDREDEQHRDERDPDDGDPADRLVPLAVAPLAGLPRIALAQPQPDRQGVRDVQADGRDRGDGGIRDVPGADADRL